MVHKNTPRFRASVRGLVPLIVLLVANSDIYVIISDQYSVVDICDLSHGMAWHCIER